MTDYCTLDDVKVELKADSTVGDAQVRRFIQQVSRRIDRTMQSRRPYFAPYTEQRKFAVSSMRVNSYENVFVLDDALLAITTVLRADEDITANVELHTPYNSVARAIRITNNTTTWWEYGDATDTPPVWVKVTGVWGWNEEYAAAYDHVDDLAANITASATSITVANVDGADLDGFTPRISAGNLIQIGAELMDVTTTDITANTATVRRGVNGTTAAAHVTGDDVNVYRVDERIRRIATRQAALLYARRGSFQVETLDGIGAVTYPQDLLMELRRTLQDFMYD